MSRRYTIPFATTLAPGLLLARRRSLTGAIGARPDAVRYYYLARNALWHGVAAAGLRPGDAILVPAYHHGVEVETLVHRGLRPIYYRIDGGMRMDVEHMLSQATPDVRALYVIHYLGFPQPIRELKDIARQRGWTLIEDCALSLYSEAPEGPLGGFGAFSIYCLYKTLPVPHGGLLRINDPELRLPPDPVPPNAFSTTVYLSHRVLEHYELRLSAWGGDRLVDLARRTARALKGASGASVVPIDTEHFEEAQVNIGVAPSCRRILDRVDAHQVRDRRRANFLALGALVEESVRVLTRELAPGVCPLSFPILVRDKPETQRRLGDAGVGTVNLWAKTRADVPPGRFPEVDELRRHVLELPVHQGLTADHVRYVARQANALCRW